LYFLSCRTLLNKIFAYIDTNISMFFQSIYAISSSNDCNTIYDKWIKIYDIDIRYVDVDYVISIIIAWVVVIALANSNIADFILDASYRIDLIDVALSQANAKNIDNIDISLSILDVARRIDVYKNLLIVNILVVIDKRN